MALQPAPENRVFQRTTYPPSSSGQYVVYWMQMHRRLESNFGLQHACHIAEKLDKPLLIYEGLRPDYPHASPRFHGFILDGMADHFEFFRKKEWLLQLTEDGKRLVGKGAGPAHYLPFVPESAEQSRGFFKTLCESASCVITDEFPVFIVPEQNRALEKKLRESKTAFLTVDSNGVIPLKESQTDPYSAYLFRKILQKKFASCYQDFPLQKPLSMRKQKHSLTLELPLTKLQKEGLKSTSRLLENWRGQASASLLSPLRLDESVGIVQSGSRREAMKRMQGFVSSMSSYTEQRNDPDAAATSGLSAYLHFGRISIHEVVQSVFDRYDLNDSWKGLIYNNGSRGFFPGPPEVDAFLDEALTWRETGYHFCFHRPDFDQFESLPDWARRTLLEHASDPREHIYSAEALENAKTHDEIWNAAQRQLRQTGIIHNYLRMLWGKKILEWTKSPREALEITLHLNNKYSIDGRNPNSYSGVFWVFGRFDRPWQERPVFGKIRYMTSEQTRKKVKLKKYLERFGDDNQGRLL
ncbi:MAG: hypothetical protein RH862_06930 [Leptospiraceae bacterium]